MLAAAAAAALAACSVTPLAPEQAPAVDGSKPESDAQAKALLAYHLALANARPASRLVRGNEATLLVDGPQTHGAMFAAMRAARDHINLETYILEAGDVGERLEEIVRQKVAQGVKVNILYDGVGSIETPKRYFASLARAGAALCEFNPVNPAKALGRWDLNNRDHRKILVVDGALAITGGINLSSAYSSGSRERRPQRDVKPGERSARGWRDTDVRAQGPIAASFQRLFVEDWSRQACGPLAPARYFPRVAPKGDEAMRLLSSDPASGKSEMYGALLSEIGNARSHVWLTVGYFAPDPLLLHALEDAARRGVDVRLVLPGFSDFWAPVYAGRSRYEELLEAGVRIYEWRQALMHAKTAVVDSVWGSVGSTNLDWRSLVHNYEADLVVYDAGFAAELERLFRQDLSRSVEVRLDRWRERGAGERLKEWLARRWEFLL